MSQSDVAVAAIIAVFFALGVGDALFFDHSPRAGPPHPRVGRFALGISVILCAVWIVSFLGRLDVVTEIASALMALVGVTVWASAYTWTRR